MNDCYVTDTIALILRLEKRKSSSIVKSIFEEAENENIEIIIPALVLAEIGYLSEKGRIETNLKEVITYTKEHRKILIEPISTEIILKAFIIDDIPELHDRIIAGTALFKGKELITNDHIILKTRFIRTVW